MRRIAGFGLLLGLLSSTVFAGAVVPNTFGASTPVNASTLNQNFDYLEKNLNLVANARATSRIEAYDDSVVAASCPTGREALSVDCYCSWEGGERNFGVLFACGSIGRTGIMGCLYDSGLYDPSKPAPLAILTVTCGNAGKIRSGATAKDLAIEDSPEEDMTKIDEKAALAVDKVWQQAIQQHTAVKNASALRARSRSIQDER